MNQRNLEYLSYQLKFTGFGAGLENEMKGKMEKQTPVFQIAHKTRFGNDDVSCVLHFKKSEQTDMYFFNRYDVFLKPEQSPENMSQSFFMNKHDNITLKEVYNLMNGRAVNKDLTNQQDQVYNTWVQFDFKQTDTHGNYKFRHFHSNYGYDLNDALLKYPIKELGSEQDKIRLIESLQKGNRQSATFMHDGSEQKLFIEANPQFKTINIYNTHMHRLSSIQWQGRKQIQSEQNSVKQIARNEAQGQGGSDERNAALAASKKRNNKQSNSIS